MLVMAPAPTVRPPSRIAKRWPTSRAIGGISSTVISTLAAGMSSSAPAGSTVVAGHDPLGRVGQPDGAGDVGRPEVELGPVAVVERGVPAALLLGQAVDLGAELRVGLDAAGLGQDLATLDLVALDAPQEAADVVAGAALVEELLEHLDAGHDDLAGGLDPDQLDPLGDPHHAPPQVPRGDGPPALDAEDVLDPHEE